MAQIRQLTDAEIAEKQKNDPASTWQQVPDISKLEAGNEKDKITQTPVKTYEIRYYQNHINGAPEELVDFSGNILWAENATAWGKDQYDIETTQRGTHQPLRFQDQYRDAETGLHYNTFRYYNPHNGRFISQDPIGLNGGINLYQYAPNPIHWIDPWGWSSWDDFRTANQGKGYSQQQMSDLYRQQYPSAGKTSRPGDFTPKTKQEIKLENRGENGGKMKCVNCNTEVFDARQSQKGVTPPGNEAHVDHKQTLKEGVGY